MDRVGTFPVAWYATLGSTNDEALALARAGELGPILIVAAQQTGGRGRHGRPWVSPPGNLYASLLLTDPAPPAVIPQIGFVAGVALALAVRDCLDGDARVCLKWPNDLLLGGAKLAGMLLESATTADGRLACVIGVGVNCRSHPDGLAYPATDCAAATGRSVTPDDVLARFAPLFVEHLARWDRGEGFASTRSAWLAMAAGLGDTMSVRAPARTAVGLFRGLDPIGRLLLAVGDAVEAFEAGDVFFPGAAPGAVLTAGRPPLCADAF